MAGSSIGTIFTVTTWGESHGKAIGAVIDGCPAGLPLSEADIQPFLDRRRPGRDRYATQRSESDRVTILSGVFEGRTTGTPISLLIPNEDARSSDYGELAELYRPGHADYGYDCKYGVRDHRGGGRASGRETAARVAAGAVAIRLLAELGITVCAYTSAIGPVRISSVDPEERFRNPFCMPDAEAASRAAAFVEECMRRQDSAGGVITCVVNGMPPGAGSPVFDKLDAVLAKAVMSVGAVKGVEIGDGFASASAFGSTNNDPFLPPEDDTSASLQPSAVHTDRPPRIGKASNHAGGILGDISDGAAIVLRAAVKPTPSISAEQQTVTTSGKAAPVTIKGRHDPVIVPRAVVVVEAMTALTIADALLTGLGSRLNAVKQIWGQP